MSNLSAFEARADADIRACAALTQDAFALATAMQAANTGSRVRTMLRALTAPAALGQSRRLAARSVADSDALVRLQARIAPLREAMNDHARAARSLREEAPPADAADRMVWQRLLDGLLLRLTGQLTSLEHCRLLLAQLQSSGHLVEDQLALLRDVTVPVAVRGTRLVKLDAMGARAARMGGEIDATCEALLKSGAARLKRDGIS